MHHDMPEQDEQRVMAVFLVLGRALPIACLQLPEARNEVSSLALEALEGLLEINREERIRRMLSLWQVRTYGRTLLTQEQVEALEEHRLDCRKVTRMLVSRPLAWAGAPLAERLRDLTNHRDDDGWSSLERIHNLLVCHFSQRCLQPGRMPGWHTQESAEHCVQLRSSIACAGFVSCNALLGRIMTPMMPRLPSPASLSRCL